jgi:Na+/H+-dicarboxylate symporter
MNSEKSANLLLVGILVGLVLGCLFGIGWIGHKAEFLRADILATSPELSAPEVEDRVVDTIEEGHDFRIVEMLGHLFINALRMLVVPLIVFSMITGIANLGDIRHVGKTGRLAILYFLITTGLSVGIGILLVNLIQPGVGSELVENLEMGEYAQSKQFSFYEVIEGFVSPNIVESMAKMDILPILIFSLVFGAILTTLGEKGRNALGFFDACNEAILKFVQLVIWFAPIGVFGLVGSKIGIEVAKGNLGAEMSRLAWYMATVIIGLGIHGFITLPLILVFFGKKNPITYIKALSQALLTAFSTSSSSATLPVTMKCAEERGKVSPKYASFVCPLGATINMDGTALYESVAVIFIAQALGHPLDASAQVVIFFTATLAAIGAAGIPEAGLVTMVVVFEAVGIDPIHIGTLFSIDWFLDRCRTTINVWGDAIGAAVVENLDTTDLEAIPAVSEGTT